MEFVSWFFPSKRKGFPPKFCVLVCNCYSGLLIFVIILFGTQQVFQLAFAPRMNIKQDKVVFRQNEEKLSRLLDIYEKRLGEARFLVSDEFYLADLSHLPNT